MWEGRDKSGEERRESEMRRYPSGSFKSLSQIQHKIVLARERNVARDLL